MGTSTGRGCYAMVASVYVFAEVVSVRYKYTQNNTGWILGSLHATVHVVGGAVSTTMEVLKMRCRHV